MAVDRAVLEQRQGVVQPHQLNFPNLLGWVGARCVLRAWCLMHPSPPTTTTSPVHHVQHNNSVAHVAPLSFRHPDQQPAMPAGAAGPQHASIPPLPQGTTIAHARDHNIHVGTHRPKSHTQTRQWPVRQVLLPKSPESVPLQPPAAATRACRGSTTPKNGVHRYRSCLVCVHNVCPICGWA